jgi:DNA-binding NarL/FixJ family response regulator
MTIRVVIADDQELIRSGLSTVLDAQPDIEVVGEAKDGSEAVTMVRRLRPDVVLMDIRMPNVDGLQATRRIVDRPDAPRVLILTTFDADEYVYEAMTGGASGFLLKDVRPEQLAHAIRVVAGGDQLLAPTVTRRLIESFVTHRSASAGVPPQLAQLTERELEVLRLIAHGRSNSEIAATLTIGEATVKTHVNRLFAKLRLRDRVQAVVLAYETGLVTPTGHQPP